MREEIFTSHGLGSELDCRPGIVEKKIGSLCYVGISGGCASMRNAPDLRIQGTFPIFIVLRGILPLPHFIL